MTRTEIEEALRLSEKLHPFDAADAERLAELLRLAIHDRALVRGKIRGFLPAASTAPVTRGELERTLADLRRGLEEILEA